MLITSAPGSPIARLELYLNPPAETKAAIGARSSRQRCDALRTFPAMRKEALVMVLLTSAVTLPEVFGHRHEVQQDFEQRRAHGRSDSNQLSDGSTFLIFTWDFDIPT